MVRGRAEHNECVISSLEEVSLHQQDIQRLQHLDRWCRDLKILYLQNNLIPRIGCESLQKLDLTVNFVGELSSVGSLKHNVHLRQLFLVGNPCSEYQGYRQYVVATLSQLQWLDGQEVSRSERIRAGQGLEEVRRSVRRQEQEYARRRAREREEAQQNRAGGEEEEGRVTQGNSAGRKETEEEREEREERDFWEKPCTFSPESRLEAHRHLEAKKRTTTAEGQQNPKTLRTLISPEGRVLNLNQPKYSLYYPLPATY
ncbi:hypothetical protein NHX12_004802 [Muraenolepis orangiensis]|uniref:U2A'/phosphoprotein 32 family A C-terminal domain-containing protein n=1 Tax=Muraenolepis orangiensis TaxID=630683 RepID=A0A9Q0DVZ6_9TELE|nr:hypothetical protein NHX12_004802 [Muraenolepis orangiensis]